VEHYIGLAGDPRAAAESVMIITRFGAERIVRYAFEYALRNGRKKVTLAHKANILKYTQGLFLEVGRTWPGSTRGASSSRTGSSMRRRCSS
jgi:isocitrate dehydrogenase (NAD+)